MKNLLNKAFAHANEILTQPGAGFLFDVLLVNNQSFKGITPSTEEIKPPTDDVLTLETDSGVVFIPCGAIIAITVIEV